MGNTFVQLTDKVLLCSTLQQYRKNKNKIETHYSLYAFGEFKKVSDKNLIQYGPFAAT